MTRNELLAFIDSDPLLARIIESIRARDDGDAAHDADHSLRVAMWTMRIDPSLDRREAIAAALLHDAINVPKDSPGRATASEACASHARELLAGELDGAAIDRVAGAIRDHSYTRGATPETALGRALQDADRLEAIGALGIMRCISTGARMGSRYFDGADPFAHDRPLDDKRYSIDHFYVKLLGLKDTMCTEAGRLEAQRRTGFLRAFLDQLYSELNA
jgi:uncharacterized protein